jgi:hypothetical protein
MQKETPYGKVLIEIESGLWDHDHRVNEGVAEPYTYTNEHFRACLKVFMSALLWKLWEKNDNDIEKMVGLAGKMGEDIKELVNAYTGINTLDLY